jgi:hypothetical protein
MRSAPVLALVLATASTSLLSVLKYVLLAVLWLFFLLVLRGVLTEVRRGLGSGSASPAKPGSAASRLAVSMRSSPARADPARAFDPARLDPPAIPEPVPSIPPRPRPFDPERFDPVLGVASLTVREPAKDAGRSYALADETTLGRSASSTVALPEDSFVSSTHARIWRQGAQVMVQDLGSTNGTFVNGNRLTTPAPLKPGDRLQVGKTVLEATR